MMMYRQTKSGCQKISSSEDIVKESYLDHISPCCDFDLEDSKQLFLYDTPAHDAASPYQIKFVKMFWGSEDIIWTKIGSYFEPLL